MKKLIAIILFCTIISLVGCWQVGFNFDNAEIIVPMALDVSEEHAFYAVNGLNRDDYFRIDMPKGYTQFRFPEQFSNGILCLAIKDEDQSSVVMKFSDSKWSEVYSTPDEILYPTVIENEVLVFMTPSDQGYSIVSKNLITGSQEILVNDNIDEKSKFVINSDGELMYVLKDGDEYEVQIIIEEGDYISIAGRYPIYISDTEILIYRNRSLQVVNMNSNNSKTVMKDVTLIESPTYSNKNNSIAFFELDYTAAIGSETAEFLSVARVGEWKKFRVESYNLNRRHYKLSGVMWD